MKKLAIVAVILLASGQGVAWAADVPFKAPPPVETPWIWRFIPSVSGGYAWGQSSTLAFRNTTGVALGGVSEFRLALPNSGPYVAAELPVALTDRLVLTVDGRWIFFDSGRDVGELYNGVGGNIRTWDTDKGHWSTVNAYLSYSVIKNASGLKDFSPLVGFRWDQHKVNLNNPRATGVLSAAGDTVDFSMNTYAAVVGVKATLQGGRWGNWGGDIRVAALWQPVCLGQRGLHRDIRYSRQL